MADVAVIGMSCRFPGEATSPEKLWKMLMARKTAWSEFPTDRMNMDGFYHPDGHRQGSVSQPSLLQLSPEEAMLIWWRAKISFRGAHFLQDDIAAFDASVSSIIPDDDRLSLMGYVVFLYERRRCLCHGSSAASTTGDFLRSN